VAIGALKVHRRFLAAYARPLPQMQVDGGRGNPMTNPKPGTYDPKTGGKFEPTTKAVPPPPPEPGRKDKRR
jgi:hypothetical protein